MSADSSAVLARQARDLLARCVGGTLHIHGVGHLSAEDVGAADVLLYDDEGRPTFLCDPDSPVTVAARQQRGAVLSVEPPVAVSSVMSALVLSGRLRVVGSEEVDGQLLAVVGLELAGVVVELDDPEACSVLQHTLPLPEYRAAVPDPIAVTAHRIVRHANDCHGTELRRFVAELRGVPAGEIAAAELTAVDTTGLDLRWLDRRGAHTARLVFPVRADSPCALGVLVRSTLAQLHV